MEAGGLKGQKTPNILFGAGRQSSVSKVATESLELDELFILGNSRKNRLN